MTNVKMHMIAASLNTTANCNMEAFMNKYEKMAEKLEKKILENKGCIEITPNEAMEIYLCLLMLSQIQKQSASE